MPKSKSGIGGFAAWAFVSPASSLGKYLMVSAHRSFWAGHKLYFDCSRLSGGCTGECAGRRARGWAGRRAGSRAGLRAGGRQRRRHLPAHGAVGVDAALLAPRGKRTDLGARLLVSRLASLSFS